MVMLEVESRYCSRRSPVLSRRGMVASSQPLASEAGLRILQAGGNAADAAVAMAAVLSVVEPCSTGLGGDAFVLFYNATRRVVESVQGNGCSSAALTLPLVRSRGFSGHSLPPFHALTVTVPGAAAAWVDTVSTHGSLPLADVLQPAIELAEQGWPVGPMTAQQWAMGVHQLWEGGPHGGELLYRGERAPMAGEVMHNPTLANTLRLLAAQGKPGFYEGPVAAAIVAVLGSRGGVMSGEDLAAHASTFHAPISSTYQGKVRVWEVGPPTQGTAALLALNILEGVGGATALPRGGAEHVHVCVEAMRLAFSDALTHVGDPSLYGAAAAAMAAALLSKEHAAVQAGRVDRGRSLRLPPGDGVGGGGSDTVYFCAVDGEGNGCSMINSNYMGFGTGIVPEGCGFSLQNRGHNFSLDPSHPNCLAPRKKPYHTIIPGLATWVPPHCAAAARSGEEGEDRVGPLHSVFGVMGGFMQPQGHLQVMSNLVDFHLDPQAALDAPRFCISGLPCFLKGHGPHPVEHSVLALEEGPGQEQVAAELEKLGHRVTLVSGPARLVVGRGQIILRDPETGVLWGGSDGRADGCAMGW